MKPYIPLIVTGGLMASLYLAQNAGVLTADQVLGLFAALGLGGTAIAKPVRP